MLNRRFLHNFDLKRLTTGLVIFDSTSRVLLLKRAPKGHYAEKYGLPAGRVQIREDIITAAWRELAEETGLLREYVTLGGYVRVYSDKNLVMVVWWGTTTRPDELREGVWLSIPEIKALDNRSGLAPNVLGAIEEAIRKRDQIVNYFGVGDISRSLALAQKRLEETYQNTPDGQGWNHYLKHKGIGIIGTSVGILAMCYSGAPINNLQVLSAAYWLQSVQCSDGGWSTRSTKKIEAVSVTESTALAVRALSTVLAPSDESITKGISWLTSNQLADGSWSTNKFSDGGTVYATCIATQALIGRVAGAQHLRSLEWLRRAQNEDGGWGVSSARSGESTPAHTAHAIFTLLSSGENIKSPSIHEGAKWLVQHFDTLTGWRDESENSLVMNSDGQDVLRFEMKHFSNPWCTRALLESGTSVFSEPLLRVLQLVLQQQLDNGSWFHPLAPNNEPIWAIHDAVMILREAQKHSSTEAFQLSVKNVHLGHQFHEMITDISHLYAIESVRISTIPRVSIFLNVFLSALLVLTVLREPIGTFLSLPSIPWVWEMLIAFLFTILMQASYGFTRATIGEAIVQRLRPPGTSTDDYDQLS